MSKFEEKIKKIILIGSSKGLGAKLTEQLIENNFEVFGISRSQIIEIENGEKWLNSGRYKHYAIDITKPDAAEKIKLITNAIDEAPFGIIFNAAHINTDINEYNLINTEEFNKITQVTTIGFSAVIEALQVKLQQNGGIFVGISSFCRYNPAFFYPTVAYPASKNFLDSALKSLRLLWQDKHLKILTVNLGYMRQDSNSSSNLFSTIFSKIVPTYETVAKKLTKTIKSKNIPDELNYPLFYNLIYRYIFRVVPPKVFCLIFHTLLKKFVKSLKVSKI